MVKEFTYRGLSQKELENLSLDKILELFPSRARRSLTRGINDNKRKLIKEMKAAKAGTLKILLIHIFVMFLFYQLWLVLQ